MKTETQDSIVEKNKLIAEFEQLGYSIDRNGVVTGVSGRKLKLHVGKCGYYQVNAYCNYKQKTFLLHRLLAAKFILNPNNLPEVNHKDGKKLNNSIGNLEWVSRSQNIKHGIDTGLIKKSMVGRTGKKHWRSKTVQQFWMGVLKSEYESTGAAARVTGYNAKSIQDACKGRIKSYKRHTWKYK